MSAPVLVVVNNPKSWPLKVKGVRLVSSRDYLTNESYADLDGARVYNLCRHYRYQSIGFYVSLLAAARGHHPEPSIPTLQDMRLVSIARLLSEDIDDLIQSSLAKVKSDKFTLSVYFGRNLAQRHDDLGSRLYGLFRAPLMRAQFARAKDGEWGMTSISPISASEIPEHHRDFVVEAAEDHFSRRPRPRRPTKKVRAHLAILYTPEEDNAPSNAGALKRFEKSARKLGIETEIITREDYGRIPEFDALFIRDNTSVNGYAYRFARRAAAEGLVVIDHPESTFRCNNKVYIAEMLRTNDLPAPRTMIIHRENLDQVEKQIGFPCILKEPDGTFSTGVKKVENEAELQERAAQFLERSELFIGQEFFPTTFDWRIGILDRKLFYAAKYHMAGSHWQIIQYTQTGAYVQAGDVEAIPLRRVPKLVRDTALRAANLIGDGLYGVDVKQRGKECFVIEVNDNPNIDAGCEDQVLGDETYDRIMQTFLKRIEALRRGARR